ncbi:hypothetical protein DFJ58DRAFT_779243 [Suillus subalutaceus]|uniref:uncharacterized protein n=1 Tax=Suillus subalutaceus TaxID=48586 RepID=UPI001B86ECF9|nr:uncharacterized protein DFJ58DRAFT_779243 [Suillus subalutaceus]KAG1860307.1 hypothetical protein DFJ58DRAFT_779243 [Suillus subalutaceus]
MPNTQGGYTITASDALSSTPFLVVLCLIVVKCSRCILIYDHMATITDEITFIWCRPRSLSAILFLTNRYFALFGNVYMLFEYVLPMSDEPYLIYRELLLLFQQIFVGLILTLRTYALYSRSKRLLVWMVTIGLVLGGGTAATLAFRSSTLVLGYNCFESYSEKMYAIFLTLPHACSKDVAEPSVSPGLGWTTLLLYELLIFVLTVHRIYKTRGPSLTRSRRNLLDIMFQDVIRINLIRLPFRVMSLVNLPNILTSYNTTRDGLAPFTSCMSVTLISRLMLNLHKSVDAGILTTPIRDDDHEYALTTRIAVEQSAASSGDC